MQLIKATRKKVKIKMLLTSPTGFGKTYSALLLAYGITGDWSKIAVIDTENESASLYSHLGEFQTIQMSPPYTIADFEKAVKMCIDAGIEVIIADSITHYWNEVKAYVDRLGSGFQNWAKGTPMWQKLLDTILQTKVHFICTSRKKQAYEMTKTDGGKAKVEKKGMEDQIRDGFDYEMTIVFDLINDLHLAKAAKDRTGLFMDRPEFVITPTIGDTIRAWCEEGIEAPEKPTETPNSISTKKEISAKAFTEATGRIKKGEADFIQKLKDTFALSELQLTVLKEIAPINTTPPAPEDADPI